MIQHLAHLWESRIKINHQGWRWLGYLLTAAAVIYLVVTILRGDLQLQQIDWKTYSATILAALGLYWVSLLMQFVNWTRLISFHRKVSWQDAEIYARMILMRSLPGGAWHWVGRISMYSGTTQVPARVVVLGNFLEWALLILVGGAFFLAYTPNPLLRVLLVALCLGAGLWLAAAWQPTARRLPARLAEAGLWLVLNGIAWISGACILYFFVQAVGSHSSFGFLEALRIWTFAGSLSMLIIFLPSSLGIREVSLTWLLQPYQEISLAILVALLIRVVFMFADIFWGLLGWVFSQFILRRIQRSQAVVSTAKNPAEASTPGNDERSLESRL